MKIGIYRANALGDLVVALPALRALRKHFANDHITLVGTRLHRELAELIPVDEIVIDPTLMRDRQLDLAIQMHGGGAQSNPLVKSWEAQQSVGFRAPGAPGLDRNLPYTYFQHEVLRFLELAAFVGASDLDTSVQIKEAGKRTGPTVIHAGATDPRRRWPAAKFIEVASQLDDCVVIGDPSEYALCQFIAQASGAKNVCGEVSLKELVPLLHEARIVIANDSGPRHLAEALGTPTVGIYWIGNLINAGPLFRQWHRTAISWRLTCPKCGTPAVLDDGTGMPHCGHDDSFVSEVKTKPVMMEVLDLLPSSRAS